MVSIISVYAAKGNEIITKGNSSVQTHTSAVYMHDNDATDTCTHGTCTHTAEHTCTQNDAHMHATLTMQLYGHT